MLVIPFLVLGVLLCFFLILVLYTKSRILPFDKVPYCQYTLVLGAGLEKNNLPTDILADRVKTAVNLFKSKKTDVLILSGSSNSQNYSEPASMKIMAESLGVKASNLIMDDQGKSTFDSCLNLSNISGVNKITIITQKFHLPRAIFLAEAMDYKVNGIPASLYKFSTYKTAYWYLREVFALPINFIKLLIYYYQLKE